MRTINCAVCGKEVEAKGPQKYCCVCKIAEHEKKTKVWQENNPDRMRELKKEWNEKNHEKIKKQNSVWYRENIERRKFKTNEYRKKNPEKVKEWNEKNYKKNISQARRYHREYYKKYGHYPKKYQAFWQFKQQLKKLKEVVNDG